MIYVIVSWIYVIVSRHYPDIRGLCGLRGYVFPQDEEIGVFEKKKVFEKILKYNCLIGIRYHSHPRLIILTLKFHKNV